MITGEEIWNDTGGQVDFFVDIAGTGGSFTGISSVLKKHRPSMRSYLAEPSEAAHFGKTWWKGEAQHQGCGYDRDLPST